MTIDLSVIATFVVRRIGWVFFLALVIAAVCTFAYLKATPRYEAVLVAVPALDDGGAGALASLANSLGPLAQLAGASVPGSSGSATEARALLGSRALYREFINELKLLPVLYAKRWDSDASDWFPGREPDLEEAVTRLDREIFSIIEDRTASVIKVRARWYDRKQAADWANRLVAMANDQMRRRDSEKASRAIDALKKEYDVTSQVEIRDVVLSLLESQMQKLTLIRVRDQYAFQVVDPAFPASERDRISPSLIVYSVLSVIFFVIAVFLLAMVAAIREQRDALQ
ncbi:MAG: hypothetical protein AAFV47_03190 [Pseudomonadota bacterium]